jgi:glyoxylate reductase
VNHLSPEVRERFKIVSTPNGLTDATAELNLALLLTVARRVSESERFLRDGNFRGWDRKLFLGLQVRGRRARIVGKGRIGVATAKLFEGIGIQCEFVTRDSTSQDIELKLKNAQILVMACPLNPSTHHWLNADRISMLPEDAIVIQTARGPVVDEVALFSALESKRIFGAGFDVYENEPILTEGLIDLPNVVLLPHIGSATDVARASMQNDLVKGLLNA